MQNALNHLDEFRARMQKDGGMLLLDFDGTLSPIVAKPADALLPQLTRDVLLSCSEHYRVAIISGRTLSDVERRVSLPGPWFAGSHGLEWHVDSGIQIKELPEAQRDAMNIVRTALSEVSSRFIGTIFEDKVHCAAVNYRALSYDDARLFVTAANATVAPYLEAGLRVMNGLRTFDVTPSSDWTKGECATMLLRIARERSGKPLVPLYIGDSITDEDAFRTLRGGITIRVGEHSASGAQFFVPSQGDVDTVLMSLCEPTVQS